MTDGWQHMKVSEFAEVVGGGTPKTAVEQYWDGEIPWVSPSDLTGYAKVYIKKGAKNISELGLSSSSTKLLPANTVLLSSRAPIGYLAIAANPICTNQGFRSLICDEKKIIPLFLYYALKVYKPTLEAFATGATFPELSGSGLKKISIPVPTIKEQEKISKILISYDNLIENNTKRIAILEQMAEQIYKEWFVRLRFPGYENTKFLKGIPGDWEVKKLKDVLTLNYGKALKSEDRIVGEYPVYGSSGIVGSHDKYLVEGPKIIIGRKGNVGSVNLSTKNFFPIDTVYYVESELSIYYLLFNLSTQNFINGDAAVPGLNRKQALSNYLFVPPPSLLTEFDSNVEPIFHELKTLNIQNRNLQKSKNILLPRLISGKLSVDQASQKLQEVL